MRTKSKKTGRFVKYWTNNEIIDDAIKFKYYSDWRIKGKSYHSAKYRKLLNHPKIKKHFKSKYLKETSWTFNKIKNSAKKYKTKKEWRADTKSSYNIAKMKKLTNNKDITGHFSQTDRTRKWTKKKILESSKGHKTIKSWRDNHPQAYTRAHRIKILDKITSKMIRLGDQYKRCIYSIKIKKYKIIYIGLTYNFDQRIQSHLKTKRFLKLRKKFGKNSLLIKKLSPYIDRAKAAEKEKNLIQKYKVNGYKILNRKEGGGLGSMKRMWNKESIYKSSKKYKFLRDWRTEESGAYQAAKKLGYLNDIKKNLKKMWEFKWDKQSVFKDALKYKTRTEWARNSRAYDSAQRNGWLNSATKHMIRGDVFWTKGKILKEALKYNKRIDFMKYSKGAYQASIREGCYLKAVSHMKKLKNQFT